MIGITILAITFILGVVAGMAALLRLGIASEKPRGSLRGAPQTRSAAATRRVLGLYASASRNTHDPGNTGRPVAALHSQNPRALSPRHSQRELPAARFSFQRDGFR